MRGFLLKLLALHSRILKLHSYLPALLRSAWALPPAIVQLELTHRCNLNCPMCYQSRPGSAEKELSTSEWKKIINSLPRWSLLTLTGGDPFMRPDFGEILAHAAERHRCNILTNGEMIAPHIGAMTGKIPLIGVSIDGLENTHDTIRCKPGLSAKVTANLRLLQQEKKRRATSWPLVDIKTVILPENISELEGIYRLAGELGADYWSLSLPKTSQLQFSNSYSDKLGEVFASGPEKTFLPGSGPARDELLRRIGALARSAGGPMIRFYPYKMFSPDAVKKHLDNELSPADFEPCRVPWSLACISPLGDVFPCLSYRVGNVRAAPFGEIWNGVEFRDFRSRLCRKGLDRCCLGCCYSVYKS